MTDATPPAPGHAPVSRNGILGVLVVITVLAFVIFSGLFDFFPNDECRLSQPGTFLEMRDSARIAAAAGRDGASGSVPGSSDASQAADRADTAMARDAARAAAAASNPDCGRATITWLFMRWDVSFEQRMLLLVILAGMLGGTLHLLRSISWYIGNRELVWSWLVYYLCLPLVGGVIAAIAYLVMRAGFFRIGIGTPFTYLASAALFGMFSTPAALRLKEVAEALFARPRAGLNTAPPQSGPDGGAAPSGPLGITKVKRESRTTGADRDALVLTVSGLVPGVTVLMNDTVRASSPGAAGTLVIPLDEKDVALLDAGGDCRLALKAPDGALSPIYDFA